MAKMYNKNKGISSTVLPFDRNIPEWSTQTSKDVDHLVCKLAKQGLVPSQIGIFLRDSKRIPLVKNISGKKILRILKLNGLAPEIPEDLFFLIKKSINIRKHLVKFMKDNDSKFRLILIESKIHRIARFYKKKKQIPLILLDT